MKTVIHWFRRDLRISDNTALSEAARRAERVIPVFIIEEAFKTGPDVGAARLTFLLHSLESLQRNLAALGYPLVIRHGRSEIELPKLCRETAAEAVFCNRRYEPYAVVRDHRVFNVLNGIGVGFEVFKDAVIWEEGELLTQAGEPFTVFTPYAKAWKVRRPLPPRPRLVANAVKHPPIATEPIPATSAELGHPLTQSIPTAGERAAQDTLKQFLDRPLFHYAANRDFPARDGTSRLSPHLRCGTVGIRSVLAQLTQARAKASPADLKGCDTFLNELIWREFYLQILANFPFVMKGNFRSKYNTLQWSENREHFGAWCAGQTGYPIVDAAMRCLNATGWMHNRLRMITAMFLTKDLLINWQWGERYFMHKLVDGDMAANNGGWQWSAGTGTDAAPYFRIFNPVTQARKCDPDGAFIRHWAPELTDVPDNLIHQPWKEPLLSSSYPRRVVIHEEQRPKALALYQRAASAGNG